MRNILYVCLFVSLSTIVQSQDTAWIDNFCNKLKAKFGSTDDMLESVENQARLALQEAKKPKQGCQSGVYGAHTYPEIKFPLETRIAFKTPFEDVPAVSYGLYILDSNKDQNLRVVTSITDISNTGFKLKMKTWASSVLYGARISWMACPKVL